MRRSRGLLAGFALAALLILAYMGLRAGGWAAPAPLPSPTVQILQEFNGASALRDVEYQVSLGPRLPGSPAHAQAVDWIAAQLRQAGWTVEIQETLALGHPVRNIIARWPAAGAARPWVILGAHYDSRMLADQDPDPARRSQPVPGANDGASGAAVLLELARVLPSHAGRLRYPQVWLVFFDAEDQGRLPGWDWILGSRAFVQSLPPDAPPEAAVVIDMIGDADLNLYLERNSDPALAAEIWGQAARLGYPQFVAQPRHTILDDHIPFKEAGIPAVDLIDFDYPDWHTTADTPDKVSASSLEAVGKVLLAWLSAPGTPGGYP